MIALTGETGAGKSIILNGINLLIGEKAFVEMIRDGRLFVLKGFPFLSESQIET